MPERLVPQSVKKRDGRRKMHGARSFLRYIRTFLVKILRERIAGRRQYHIMCTIYAYSTQDQVHEHAVVRTNFSLGKLLNLEKVRFVELLILCFDISKDKKYHFLFLPFLQLSLAKNRPKMLLSEQRCV